MLALFACQRTARALRFTFFKLHFRLAPSSWSPTLEPSTGLIEMKGASVSKWLKILTMLGYLDNAKSQRIKEERIGCQHRSTSGRDYAGEANTTKEGLPCQKWSETKPHDHSFTHVGDHNFCRNPNGVPASEAWCYTTDPEARETPLQKTPCKFLGIACFLFFWLVGGLITFHEYKFFLSLHNGHFLDFVGSQKVCLDGFCIGVQKSCTKCLFDRGGGDSSLGNAQVDEAFL